jgi:protein tyrosine/serine phosphatase
MDGILSNMKKKRMNILDNGEKRIKVSNEEELLRKLRQTPFDEFQEILRNTPLTSDNVNSLLAKHGWTWSEYYRTARERQFREDI